jgi:FkbM family methyltransferase
VTDEPQANGRPERAVRRPARLNRPHYLFAPGRLAARRLRPTPGHAELPWGLPLSYGPSGPMGNAIARAGIYDLAVTEVVYRLLAPGDLALDVGANVGYMTSIMASRVGPQGQVVSFEPQPEIYATLERNVREWRNRAPIGDVTTYNDALSDVSGVGALNIPRDNDPNHERASLRDFKREHSSIEVQVSRLDDVSLPAGAIALLKLDTERHELEVLRGAHSALSSVTTLIVEEHEEPPTPVTELLLAEGFSLFTVGETLLGPQLRPLQPSVAHVGWGPPNVLATRAPDELRAALQARGWRALGRRGSGLTARLHR